MVVLDHDGGEMTLECVDRLVAAGCDAARLEIVLVDNASRRPVVDEVRRRWPAVEVRRSPVNTGFSGGNNLALRDLDGIGAVALVNNDALVEPGWLEPLIDVLDGDARVGAACPKILFADRFRSLVVDGPAITPGGGDHRRVAVRWYGCETLDHRPLDAYPVAGFFPPELDRDGWFRWAAPGARILVPDVGDRTAVRVRTAIGRGEPTWREVVPEGEPVDIVNNAGTIVVDQGYGADRGFLEADDGRYDEPADVPAWCGGAVLLRTAYLDDVGLFDERLFLYYEDLELSLRGAARGWTYRYEPASVVRHRHGATAVHGSPLAEHYKERNRLLVVARRHGLRAAVAAALRYLLATASYARRDIVYPVLRGERPHAVVVRRRLRSFVAFVRMAPSMLRSRRPGVAPPR